MNPKQRAAEAAIPFIQDGMVVGLGTGSTAEFFIAALGRAVKQEKVRNIVGIPTSVASERQAAGLGIPLTTLAQHPVIDVAVDGADEVSPALDLIKGLGGALLREKIVEQCAKTLVIVVDGSKVVPALGTKDPLPVEVAQFGYESHVEYLKSLGATPELRRKEDGSAYVTDNGNFIYHCRFKRIDDPAGLDAALKRRAGIIETGLFVGMAKVVLVAEGEGVRRMERKS